MVQNMVGWFEIYVDDIDRARKFYETVFDTNLTKMDTSGSDSPTEMWSFESDHVRPGSPGALIKMEGFSAGHNSIIVYFSCEDCAIEESRVIEAGGTIHKEKVSLGENGFMSLVIDSEGNMIGLHSMK